MSICTKFGGASFFALTVAFASPAAAVNLKFYYPVAVTGPLTKIIGELVDEFHKEHPDINVEPVFAGNYADTLTKSLTAARGGQPPQVIVAAASDTFTLIDEDVAVPLEDVITDADKPWLDGFMPSFMSNVRIDGKTWGVPFQRSVQVLLYNKDKFKEAGLNPDQGPATWDELIETAKKLTVSANGATSQWGVLIPSGYTARWYFNGLSIPAGAELTNDAGTAVNLASPESISAMQFLADLSQKHNVMPKGVINTGTAPDEFINGRAAMLYASTGNIANVRTQAKFDLGVGLIPAGKQPGGPTGGGNMVIFKGGTAEQQQASLTFVKWMTNPERSAKWSIETGYVAGRQDAWETPTMKAFVEEHPEMLVTLRQLEVAKPEFGTHNGARVTKALEDAIAQVVTGDADPKTALEAAQKTAEGLLREYR
ncbi:ABC transporter substrate-binding protein [Pararhizobium sp. O133]|uniref:ABC transporter substrate-binding protein n=1 Tax=Pararhizobium sp. O133 TaxID=3449278 RepID=UPI003F6878C0